MCLINRHIHCWSAYCRHSHIILEGFHITEQKITNDTYVGYFCLLFTPQRFSYTTNLHVIQTITLTELKLTEKPEATTFISEIFADPFLFLSIRNKLILRIFYDAILFTRNTIDIVQATGHLQSIFITTVGDIIDISMDAIAYGFNYPRNLYF